MVISVYFLSYDFGKKGKDFTSFLISSTVLFKTEGTSGIYPVIKVNLDFDLFHFLNSRMQHIFKKNIKSLAYILLVLLLILLSSCGGSKYDYHFEKDKELDFNQGKWILNDPQTNYRYPGTIKKLALEGFQKIIPDSSLFQIFDLRRTRLVEATIPIHPTLKDLKHLREFSSCDYLINIENEVVRDDMGSFSGSSTARNEQTNKAATYIEIYDLRTFELISKSSAVGTVKVTEDKDSGSWNYVSSGGTLAMHSVIKLIRRYKRYRVKK